MTALFSPFITLRTTLSPVLVVLLMEPRTLRPSRTIVTSFTPRKASSNNNYDDGDWVLSLSASVASLSCALSNGEIQVYDLERLHLTHSCPFYSNSNALLYATPTTLVSAHQDGTLVGLDLRQRSTAPVWNALVPNSRPLCLAMGYDSTVLVTGTDKGALHFVDLRQSSQFLATYTNGHTTQQPVNGVDFCDHVVLSGGDDGLMGYWDTRQATPELALQSVCQVGAPVQQVGLGPSCGAFALTGNETVSLWQVAEAKRVWESGVEWRQSLQAPVDYLVEAYWHGDELRLLGGSRTGDSVVVGLQTNGAANVQHVLRGGHRGVVRAWTQTSPTTWITAGEDARLCEWSTHDEPLTSVSQHFPLQSTATATTPVHSNLSSSSLSGTKRAHTTGGPVRRHKHKQSTSPY